MLESALFLLGVVLGLTGEIGLLLGLPMTLITATLAALSSPNRELLDGLPLALWLLLSLLATLLVRLLWKLNYGAKPQASATKHSSAASSPRP
ncbi:MAG TPA: hypothetical protein VFW68_11015 [Rhodocyclaceae bacterium]|nr:hypothetical protein [Rhodocyclaceae bacterium]